MSNTTTTITVEVWDDIGVHIIDTITAPTIEAAIDQWRAEHPTAEVIVYNDESGAPEGVYASTLGTTDWQMTVVDSTLSREERAGFIAALDDFQRVNRDLLDGRHIDPDIALAQLPLTADQLYEGSHDEHGNRLRVTRTAAAAWWLGMNDGPWWTR